MGTVSTIPAAKRKPKVLVVDDEVDNLQLVQRVLRKDYEVHLAESGAAALKVMEEHDFFLILTDQRMPGMLGTEFLKESLKRQPTAVRILITGYTDIDSVIDAINKGSVHRYIKKPWKSEELRQEIVASVELQRLIIENQELVKILQEANEKLMEQEKLLLQDLDGRAKELFAVNRRLQEVNEQLKGLTLKDGLTGLYNHRGFQERLKEEFSRAKRMKAPLTLVFFDIDHFKHYNDTNGHPAGDDLLRSMGSLLSESSRHQNSGPALSRDSDVVARYGGEEFAILLPDTAAEGGKIQAERIRKAVDTFPFPFAEKQPLGRVSVSIGIASFPEDASLAAELIDRADRAMYFVKANGRNAVKLFRELK